MAIPAFLSQKNLMLCPEKTEPELTYFGGRGGGGGGAASVSRNTWKQVLDFHL